jgi:cellulose biosynthesis protein BcsQ
MPTIAFVSPKGGAGKTTSAFLLSTELAKLYDVTLIDGRPQSSGAELGDGREHAATSHDHVGRQ